MAWWLLAAPSLGWLVRWLGIGLVVFCVFFLAPAIGLHSQAWSAWWFAGANLSPPGVVPVSAPPQGPLPADDSALLRAIQPWLGVGYLFGGCSHSGVDCSCFVQLVYRSLGVALPRTAQAQYDATQRVSQPMPGDLVFFEHTYSSPDRVTHVGIVVGDGLMISAAEPAVGRQSLASPFWVAHFAGFGRVR